ncbi:MAG: VPLPA-CTERM sorting domain-containing protein [Pseudomonadota bacterium]
MTVLRSLDYPATRRAPPPPRPMPYRGNLADLCRVLAIAAVFLMAGAMLASSALGATIKPVEGPGNSPATNFLDHPFAGGALSTTSQLIWNSSLIATEPVTLTGITFFTAPSVTSTTAETLTISQMTLSATSSTSSSFSNTFANNVAIDPVTVLSGPVTFAPTGGSAPDTFTGGFTFDFAVPYTYDPAAGSLMLSIEVATGASLPDLDRQIYNATGASYVQGFNGQISGTQYQNSALIVEFTTGEAPGDGGDDGGTGPGLPAVPLPAGLPLMLASIGALAALRLRSQRNAGRV